MIKNVYVEIAYDGSAFDGWQRLPDKKTVQGYIERTLTQLLKQIITIDGSGRTDKGVHAINQSFTFQYEDVIPVDNLKVFLSNKFEKSVKINTLEEVPLDFHARYSAKKKSYIYKINYNKDESIFYRNYFCFTEELDHEKMKEAAQYLVGEHDFSAFSSNGNRDRIQNKIRTIYSIDFIENGTNLTIRFTGNGFLYRMIRLIVYHLIEVGKCHREPETTKEILQSASRKYTNRIAPAEGLYLEKVTY